MRRAISPAITSILLMGVAVAGAAAAGDAMYRQNEISYKSAKLDISDVSLIRLSDSKTYFAGTVKNTGTTIFLTVRISFVDDSGAFHSITSADAVEPGSQFSSYEIKDAPVVSGRKYLVQVEGIAPDSAFRTAKTVTAR